MSADEFVEQQRLETLRLAEPLAEAGGLVVGLAADVLIPATDSAVAEANEAAYFAYVGPVEGLLLPAAADTTYVIDMLLIYLPASDLSAPQYWLDVPVDASGRLLPVAGTSGIGELLHADSGDIWDPIGWRDLNGSALLPDYSMSLHTGFLRVGATAGDVVLRMGQKFTGATTEDLTLMAGSLLRLTPLS